MSSLTKRLASKVIEQDIKYEKESMHNVVAITHNAVVSIASKDKDNILCIIVVLVNALHPAGPSNPTANPIHTLLKAPNALVIKKMHILSKQTEGHKATAQAG